MKIAYLGPKGSYTHITAKNIFASEGEDSFIPYKTITDVVEAISKRKVDQAVLPVENSIEGGVSETIDSLLNVEEVYVTKEYVLPINHCLVADDGVALNDVTHVYAHPISFAQCRKFLHDKCDHVEKEVRSSNSAAAVAVAKHYGTIEVLSHAEHANGSSENKPAAIAPELCAEIYNLKVLAKGISDVENNVTRFWVLTNEPSAPTGDDKTTIVFQVKDEPGSLVRVLQDFADSGVNLSRIESRPSKRNLGEYSFCIDFNIHKEDDKFAEVMRKVKMHFTHCKWLGSYSLLK